MHHVILGNGVAGMEAALALRARDDAARITLVSAEHDHFFSRPALMYVFAGQTSLRDTEPYDRGLYERMRFERVSRRVASLDAAGQALVLEDGSRLAYDRLLLAVGSKARPAPWPGAEGPGLPYFVTLRDLEALDREAKTGMKAAVLGGGLIGVEVAEVLHDRGLHVTFVIREGWYFPVALDRNEASLVAEHARAQGVDVRLGASVDAVLRGDDGRIRGVRLAGGDEVAADLVVSTIGVVPNTGFLAGSALTLAKSGAIETDDGLRTSAPDVWAAGDCANVTWYDGSRRPEQLWYTARDQGRLAARSMLGDEIAYRRGAWYNSAKFFDLEYTTAGYVPVSTGPDGNPVVPPADLRTWFQRVPGRFESQRIVVKGDRVVGFNMLGSRWNHEPLLDWIQDRRPLEWVLKHLPEAQFDEEFSPRFRVLATAGVV
ncbi:MAG TPA: NAD(P)/FAD-dependent oxidoreductase [Thermoleophilaceae bacterium]|nr:NAD(P)/FAD-dependent oxidoreductase [Thermoleophilaceae bacterium]